jgi:hypothetical protein
MTETTQNNHRNPRYPEIPQPSHCSHIFFFWSEQSLRAEMTGDLRHVPLGALAVRGRIGSQLDKFLLSEN